MTIEELKDKYGNNCIGRVIRILNETTLIIDAGKNFLKTGDFVQVYEHFGNIKGLDGEDLGSFDYSKIELEVVQTEELYSICKTQTYTKKITLVPSPLFERTEQDTFSVSKEDIEDLPVSDKIHLGDPVKKS